MIRWMFWRPEAAPDPRLAFAVAEAVRGIDGQQENLDNLRSRVGILLSAATIATSFLGGIALEPGRSLTIPGFVAIALFIAHVACGLVVLWPRVWKLHTSPQYMIQKWIDELGYDDDQMRRRFVYWANKHTGENAERLNWLWGWYAAAIVLLGAEIVAWTMELGGFQGWLVGLLSR